MIRRGIDTLMKLLSMDPAAEYDVPPPKVRVFTILGSRFADKVAEGVYLQHSSVATIFGCKSLPDSTVLINSVLHDIQQQVGGHELQPSQEDEVTNQAETKVMENIQRHLKGKRFFIVVRIPTYDERKSEWKRMLDGLLEAADRSLPGSAIIMTTNDYDLALSFSPYKIINAASLVEFYSHKAHDLKAFSVWKIFHEDFTDFSTFARKMLLHLLYVKPTMTAAEKDMYREAIYKGLSLQKSVDHTMVMLCYNELPSKYRSFLLHLTIFPQGYVIKSTTLARRWIAEGLIITSIDQTGSEADKGRHYLDVLFIRGFISPMENSAAGNIKSFTLKDEVHNVITKIARDANIVDTNLPIHLARHLSIHSRIVLPKSHSIADSEDIVASLQSLAASPQWKLLKVLDLEGCHGLEKHHLKSICKVLLLKYLSLRNTDVAELPKEIKELQCLETLDIRETKVRVLAKKATVLPLLKHLLAGHKVSAAIDSMTSEDSFSAVQMPLRIEKMTNMEVLSHVLVSNSKELAGIELLKLRKLGVALHGKHTKLSDLFSQIKKMHRCLRSLSIRIDPEGGSDVGMVDPLPSIPGFIERLNISGITGGLCQLIQEHLRLTKITLCQTHLEEDDLALLGKLGALHCLRLQHNSYTTECEIVFREEKFQSLNYLLVEDKDITQKRFRHGAAPKLERIVWSFDRMDALTGLNHLSKLKELELNGNCDLDPIENVLLCHPNDPTVKYKPQHQGQEGRTAAPTSSSSAP